MKIFHQRFKTSGASSLTLITILFMSSAVIRVAFSADSAFAQSTQGDSAAKVEPINLKPENSNQLSVSDERSRLKNLLELLQEKQAKLDEREKVQETRQKALDDAAIKINDRLAQITDAENKLLDTLALSNSAAEDDLARLTTVYENMKPKDAAALFEAMKPEFAAGFVGRMRPDAAADIMAGLKPEFAYSISVILAGRNANAKKSS